MRHVTAAAFSLALVAGCHSAPAPNPRIAREGDAMLFSYFTRNGEDGLHLAYSEDGTTWKPINGGRSLLTPAVTGNGIGWQEWDTRAALMRDPSILRAPDGTFYMAWTISWTDRGIGVAKSKDLIHWSEQRRIGVMDHEPNALNAWAPDLFWDDATKEFVIVWSTSIPGRFPATDSLAEKTSRGRADHRLYYTTTKDFVTFAPGKLLYDGGYPTIDGTIAKVGARYVLVMKDETFFPERRNLRVAFADKATGPYGPASPAFTDLHTEGPSILRTGGWWYVYYDEYTRGHYGAVRTQDFVTFDSYRDSLRTPRGIRHGSAFLAPKGVLQGLLALDGAK